MIHLKANTRRAVALSDDLITSGSAGIEVEILCSDAWEGLTKTVLFRGSGSSVDLVLSGCSCTVPPEVLTVPGGQLLIGLYGSDGSGNLAIPTVWADAGRILQGAEPSGIAPTPAQKSALDQAIAALNAAAEAIPEQVNAAVEEAVSSGTFADVFWITLGLTTADEIYAANAAGKICLMQASPDVLYYLTWCGEVRNLGPSGVVLEKQAILTAWDGDEKTTIRVMNETWSSPSTVKFARTASPTFTGAPKAPTVEAGTNNTQIASTAFVNAAIQAALEGFTPGQTISEELKQALLQLARKVAYIDDQGETYYQDLYDALYPPAVLESIEAVFVQGSTVIYNTDSLDVLKPLLTVTAVYDDGSTETVPAADYTLSGALATGASTITASYQDKTATFRVTVTAAPMSFSVTNNLTGCSTSNSAAATMENEPYTAVITPAAGYTLTGASVVITMAGSDITASAYSGGVINIAQVTGALVISIVAQEIVLSSISAAYTQSGVVYNTDTLESLKADLVVTAAYSDGTSTVLAADAYTLSGTLAAGTSTITVSFQGKSTSFQVVVTVQPVLDSITATYTQSGTVYDTDTLDSLKTDLVVTATYSDSSTQTVPAAYYTLSGTLTVGTSTITVSYGGKTTTFSVTVSEAPSLPTEYQQVEYIKATGTQHIITDLKVDSRDNTGANSVRLYTVDIDFQFDEWQSSYATNIMAGFGATAGLWIGYANAVTNIAMGTSSENYFSGDPTERHQYHWKSENGYGVWTRDDSASISRAFGTSASGERDFDLFYLKVTSGTQNNFHFNGKLYSCKVFKSGVAVLDLYPCYRKSDGVIGLYDTVNDRFYTNNGTGAFEKGADVA